MTSLYDVFSAICADEGDHVSTMAACLDPEASLQSPSLERRVLTGVALLAVAPYVASTLDIPTLLDTGDAAAGFTDTATVLELTGLAGIVQKLLEDGLEVDIAEGGILLAIGEAFRQFTTLFIRFF